MQANRSLVAAAGWLLAVAACQPAPRDPAEVPVARVDGETVTLLEFERYLGANLVSGGVDATGQVGSRLFDTFLEERALLAEAARVGVDPAALEAEAYRRAVESDPIREPDVRAYLNEHRARLSDRRRITLRSLPLDSMDEAARLRRRILSRETTFEAAGPGPPLTVDWQDLAEELRRALEALAPGEISPPVETLGEVYLFRIESRDGERPPDEESLLRRARAELLERRRQAAYRAWTLGLLERNRVEPMTENLPFSYVPPAPPRGAGRDGRAGGARLQ